MDLNQIKKVIGSITIVKIKSMFHIALTIKYKIKNSINENSSTLFKYYLRNLHYLKF
ncbi:hypothetical protein HMPREF9129_1900 [Peptoniphilus indolicus ATCC 29427]|uniref:Uncharacterized protein n=1 Tax=Peptoniphilus indolicus ATCC 29427 TaxID=997350 RepID=G4D670_9FIRM|nr:hypothetical protein HMPREF9129_1900 [Peptoniphilus indolicus ATCC 29427]